MKVYVQRIEDPNGDLFAFAQDVKRMSDLLSAYNLGLSFVDKFSGMPVQLDFDYEVKYDRR